MDGTGILQRLCRRDEQRRRLKGSLLNDRARQKSACNIRFVAVERHHAAGKLTLEQLSQDMNLSQRQIQRILREKMNDTFLSLLSRYRVMIAARAMGQEDRSLSRIAEEAGFSSYGAFCRSFQRYKGMSPDAYRQSMKKLP